MPVKRGETRRPSNSRRAAPAQQRRTAAAAPTRRAKDADPDETKGTAFDNAGSGDSDDEDEDLPEVMDLSGISAPSRVVIPKGWYDGVIEEVEYGRSNANNPQLVFKVLITVEEEDEKTGEVTEKERSLRYYGGLAGDGAPYTKALLSKLDPEIDFATFKPADADEMFSDMEVRVLVTVRPDKNDRRVKRNNISDMEPLDEEDEDEDA